MFSYLHILSVLNTYYFCNSMASKVMDFFLRNANLSIVRNLCQPCFPAAPGL